MFYLTQPGCCQAVVVNLLALLMGLGCIGVPIWTSWNSLTADNVDLQTTPELVYLIAILFSGVVVVIASIAGIFVGFLPSNGSSRVSSKCWAWCSTNCRELCVCEKLIYCIQGESKNLYIHKINHKQIQTISVLVITRYH